MKLFNLADSSSQISSAGQLFELLVESAGREGFEYVAYAAVTYNEQLRLSEHPFPAVALNYPRQWQDHYVERKYSAIDPVLIHARARSHPFLWRDLFDLEPRQRLLLQEAREAGLDNGISIPLHGPWGRIALVSFATRFNGVDPKTNACFLAALASQFHTMFTVESQAKYGASSSPKLSPREKDCLSWTAQGKSSWDISAILMISENTVNFHIKNVMRKLGTNSRIVAVVIALRENLIDLPYG